MKEVLEQMTSAIAKMRRNVAEAEMFKDELALTVNRRAWMCALLGGKQDELQRMIKVASGEIQEDAASSKSGSQDDSMFGEGGDQVCKLGGPSCMHISPPLFPHSTDMGHIPPRPQEPHHHLHHRYH